MDVDDVVLTIRAFPIRVAGNSGPLFDEIDWETVTAEGGHSELIVERTSVTKRVRRVGRFDPKIVRTAIEVNRPTRIVLNHLDYLLGVKALSYDKTIKDFVQKTEISISRNIDFLGFGPDLILRNKHKPIFFEAFNVRHYA